MDMFKVKRNRAGDHAMIVKGIHCGKCAILINQVGLDQDGLWLARLSNPDEHYLVHDSDLMGLLC